MKHALDLRLDLRLVLALVLSASTAAAQPMPRPDCAVTIARAPDDVRAVIDQWVQAEPSCTVKLEIRVVPTEGGLYLLARDDSGRVRERIVPDAQAAGVLVASWVAADSTSPTPYDVRAPGVAPQPAPPPVVAPAQMPVAVTQPPSEAPVVAPAVTAKTRWLSLGAMAAMDEVDGGGVRAEWDAKTRGWATFGIAGSVSESGANYYTDDYYYGYGSITMTDTKLVGYLALTSDWGKWHLRTAIGLGAVYTHVQADNPNGNTEASGLFGVGELTLSIGRDLTPNWGLSAGPVVSVYGQDYYLDNMSTDYYSSTQISRDLDTMLYFALRHRL